MTKTCGKAVRFVLSRGVGGHRLMGRFERLAWAGVRHLRVEEMVKSSSRGSGAPHVCAGKAVRLAR